MNRIQYDRGLAYMSEPDEDDRRDILPNDDPPPCDGCTFRSRCAVDATACRAFVRWVGNGRHQERGKTDVPNLGNMDRAMRL